MVMFCTLSINSVNFQIFPLYFKILCTFNMGVLKVITLLELFDAFCILIFEHDALD